MNYVETEDLRIAYELSGPDVGPVALLLHGFPYDVRAYDVARQRLASAGIRCIIPYLRGYGPTRFRTFRTMRSGQQAALANDLLQLMNALNIQRPVLVGYDWGGRAACVVSAMWPDLVGGLVSCGSGYNIHDTSVASKPITLDQERRYWYWYYLNSERGQAALATDRAAFCRFLWKDFSPEWWFDTNVFDATATSFTNPDFVDVVLHSYRFRIGSVAGDPRFEWIEQQLSSKPKIKAPTIILQGGSDAVDPPSAENTPDSLFPNLVHHTILEGVGHNLPQEAPDALSAAVISLISAYRRRNSE